MFFDSEYPLKFIDLGESIKYQNHKGVYDIRGCPKYMNSDL